MLVRASFKINDMSREINFIGSFENESQCPQTEKPEVAFIGRSNVGKSSLINMLLQRKEIARTSKKPGKTQTINLFEIDSRWMVADLPGYGYAKVSKAQRRKWEVLIERYLLLRPNLVCTFVLIDIRHPLQQNDLEFINWLGERTVPFVLVYTKADKLKPADVRQHATSIRDGLLEYWHALPNEFITSAAKGLGREEMNAYIDQLVADFYLTQESRS